MSVETRQIVAQCLSGSSRAFGTLVDRYRAKVYALCYRYLQQRQDAEDAEQETFMRVARSLGSWNPARDFEPWLMAIAANRCRTMLAQRGRRPLLHAGAEEHEAADPPVAGQLALQEELTAALQRLRPHYRDAFLAFHRDQRSYEEISIQLGRPVGTVKTWVHRARQEMMGYLANRGVSGAIR